MVKVPGSSYREVLTWWDPQKILIIIFNSEKLYEYFHMINLTGSWPCFMDQFPNFIMPAERYISRI
jgi:hypothetical protein